MELCLACNTNTGNIIKCSSHDCVYKIHDNCLKNLDKCIRCWDKCISCCDNCKQCSEVCNHLKMMKLNHTTRANLVKMVDDNSMNLINNYSYNSRDLQLLVKENLAAKIIIISHSNKKRIYTYTIVGSDEIHSINFRENFLKFHNELRIKYIFINNQSSTDNDKPDEIWKWGSGSNLIGRYAGQVSW
jgi:hypothetical protein